MRKPLFISLFILTQLPIFSQSNNDVVMLSDQCHYLGRKSYLRPGVYMSNQLGIADNSLSSFHVPPGMALQVFESNKYMGRTETFYSSVLCLPSLWNNKVSSIKIYFVNDPGNENDNGSGNNIPPQGNKVIFYRDMKYSGMARAVGEGNFGSGILGFLTDNASSVYIPSGYSVRVNDKQGRTMTFTGSVSSLAQYGWDNRINSGFIEVDRGNGGGSGGNQPPQGDKVIFYGDSKYSGMSRVMGTGSFSPGDLGFLSGNVSSVYIPPGQSIKVYDRNSNNRTFTTSVSDLNQYGWNDRITTGIITGSSGGGTTPPPQGNQVIFYRDMKYTGMAKAFGQGNHSSGNLGFLNNNISSIYIPYGWAVQATDSRGARQTFTNSISSLSQYGWDNRIRSVYIYQNGFGSGNGGEQGGNGGNQTVKLYYDANYRGNEVPCGEGRINYIGLGADNNISSIQVPPGWAVVLYDGQNLTGASRTFTSSVTNLAVHGWNDRVSSVYVYRQ